MNEPRSGTTQPGNFEFDALRAAANYRRALVREFSPHLCGRVIEVGCGIGQMTGKLRQLPAIQYLLSLEPEGDFCRQFKELFPAQPLIQGTIASVAEGTSWNAIVSINVLEHIRDDAAELAVYHRLLSRAQGRLCLFVPARQEIFAPVDKDFGHHRRYSKPELRQKLEAAGFENLRLNYFNCIGYFAWWFNFRILRRRKFDVASVRFFDRMIFPFVHTFESHLLAPPFGQSLLAVARAR